MLLLAGELGEFKAEKREAKSATPEDGLAADAADAEERAGDPDVEDEEGGAVEAVGEEAGPISIGEGDAAFSRAFPSSPGDEVLECPFS